MAHHNPHTERQPVPKTRLGNFPQLADEPALALDMQFTIELDADHCELLLDVDMFDWEVSNPAEGLERLVLSPDLVEPSGRFLQKH